VEQYRELLRVAGRRSYEGKARWIGCYELPLYEDVYAFELLIHRPWWRLHVEYWYPQHEPPGWSDEWGCGLADVYLSLDGEELIGSYLAPPPMALSTRLIVLCRTDAEYTAFWLASAALKLGREPESQPIPERLLRLIWLDDA
jgi:hypothetical protein